MKTYHRAMCMAPLALIASQVRAEAPDTLPSTPMTSEKRGDERPRLASATETHSQDSKALMVPLEQLARMRGGAQTAVNQQTFISDNSGGTIGGDFTAGDVSLSDNALSSFNGLGNIVINTGAQSSLQAGLGVTINISE